ncbi:hypothetical protein [Pelagicoccus albus]|uniref:Flagellar hook-length control protein FliK n=1 Tax=Pelagicoccus albus TaxID=415222 RepID=A0A7X1B5Z9_9BACT|nr:hypothetical protein [Pelagicoccus albus]MBC2606009.1 hypothetical protein [Pelagicoccus albus]
MPIEPSSVSTQKVREVETSSAKLNLWASMQGSSTGGKDSPAASNWEDAIVDAQKLYDSPASESEQEEDASPSDSSSVSALMTSFSGSGELVPGFASRGFGSFSFGSVGSDAFGAVSSSRNTPSEDLSQSSSLSDFKQLETKDTDSASVIARSDESVTDPNAELESDESEEGGSEKKSSGPTLAANATRPTMAAPVVASPLAQVQAPASDVNSVEAPPAASVATTVSAQPTQVVTEQAPSATAATSTPNSVTEPVATAAPVIATEQSPKLDTQTKTSSSTPAEKLTSNQTPTSKPAVESVTAVSDQSLQKPLVASTVEQGQGNKITPEKNQAAVAQAPVAQKEVTANVDTPANPVSETPVQSKSATGQPATEKVAANDGLGFDVSKAKETISDAIGKVATDSAKRSQPTATTSQSATSNSVATASENASTAARPSLGETTSSKQAESGATTESKDFATQDAAKRESAAVAAQRVTSSRNAATEASGQARTTSQIAETAQAETKLAQAGNVAAATSQASRDASAVAATRSTVSTQGKANAASSSGTTQSGVSGVSASQSMASGMNTQNAGQSGSQSQGEGDPAAKQDFNTALKQSLGAKTADKSAGENGQSFDAKVDAATASRRSEAASKSQQTSYVSKTAAEVKEVVATLTKSIDRLVTDKSGAMNLKINFEGGGSVNLRVKMEGGQVSTQMQTDVVGLEAAIKANWSELSNDWNQKGVKLNTPQFQNSESGKDSSFESLDQFASRQERQSSAGESGSRQNRGSFNSGGSFTGSAGQSSETEQNAPASEVASQAAVSDKELKTYA